MHKKVKFQTLGDFKFR